MRFVFAAVAALLGLVQAYKDQNYYPKSVVNVNVYDNMYWRDAENVLEDLQSFSSLYVKFHNCAWSNTYTTVHSDSSSEDDDMFYNSYWYRGITALEGANVAYTLYGAVKGETFSGCNKDTYINSFYTNTGFTNFLYHMSETGKISYDTQLSDYCQGGYGVGCYSGKFAVLGYGSNTCDPNNVKGVMDDLSSLNSALQSVDCIQIYNGQSSRYGSGSSYHRSQGDDDWYYGGPVDILTNSSACVFDANSKACPDPYNKLNKFKKLYKLGPAKDFRPYYSALRKSRAMMAFGGIFAGLALALLVWELHFRRKVTAGKQIAVKSGEGDATAEDGGGYVQMANFNFWDTFKKKQVQHEGDGIMRDGHSHRSSSVTTEEVSNIDGIVKAENDGIMKSDGEADGIMKTDDDPEVPSSGSGFKQHNFDDASLLTLSVSGGLEVLHDDYTIVSTPSIKNKLSEVKEGPTQSSVEPTPSVESFRDGKAGKELDQALNSTTAPQEGDAFVTTVATARSQDLGMPKEESLGGSPVMVESESIEMNIATMPSVPYEMFDDEDDLQSKKEAQAKVGNFLLRKLRPRPID